MANKGIEFTGVDRLVRALRAAGDLVSEAAQAAMVDEMDAVMEDAKRRAPVDTGTMRASGGTLPPERKGTQITVTAGFGGAASDYVVVQHEDLNFNHRVGEAKFLEKAMYERAVKIPRNLAVRINAALRRLQT